MDSNQGANDKARQEEVAQFKTALEAYTQYCTDAKIRAVAYQDVSLPLFQALNSAERKAALQTITDANNIFQMVRIENMSLTDNKRLLWRALSRWGLSPSNDTFDLIQKGDYFQVYSNQHIALFWSPDLMSQLSLTLEQIFTQPWYKNVVRSEADSMALFEAGNKIFSGECKTDMQPGLPEHYLKEMNSYGDNEFMMKIKWLCPLRAHGETKAVLLIHTCRLLSSKINMS